MTATTEMEAKKEEKKEELVEDKNTSSFTSEAQEVSVSGEEEEMTDVEQQTSNDDDSKPTKDNEEEEDTSRKKIDAESSSSPSSPEADSAPDKKKDSNDSAAEEKKETTVKKTRTEDWPLRDIKDPHDNDVLYGRGGGTNHHPGNKRYRKMVEDRKLDYVNSKRLDKPLVALEIIREWRAQEPPGRFLKIDEKTGLWLDVGDKKAREKTSQALREKAPQIRQQQEEQNMGGRGTTRKTTRFAPNTVTHSKSGKNKTKKPILARDHSLGREYLEAGEAVTLDGFSWQDPFGRSGSSPGERIGPRQYSGDPNFYAGGGNDGGMHAPTSPQQGPYGASGRYDSWGNAPPQSFNSYPTSSGSSWNEQQRDHSLGQNPLSHGSVSQSARYDTFERRGSGQWGGQPPSSPSSGHPYQSKSSAYMNDYSGSGSRTAYPVSPPYTVDPSVASQWSGQKPNEITQTWSGSSEEYDRFHGTNSPSHHRMPQYTRRSNNYPLKPDIVKRQTSNQNETLETKPDLRDIGSERSSVKRAALNRDNSLASNRLKEKYLPNYNSRRSMPKPQCFDSEMRKLSNAMGSTGLRPRSLANGERVSTLDMIAMDLAVKPTGLKAEHRSSTIEALNLDLDETADSILGESYKPKGALQRSTTMEAVFADLEETLEKPGTLAMNDRLTTTDYMDMVNAPIGVDEAGNSREVA